MAARYKTQFDDPRDEALADAINCPTRQLMVTWSLMAGQTTATLHKIVRDDGEVCTNDDVRRERAYRAIAPSVENMKKAMEPVDEIEEDLKRLDRIEAQIMRPTGPNVKDIEWMIQELRRYLERDR